MQTFTDAQGTPWTITLDLTAALRIDDSGITSRGRPVVFTEPEDWLFAELLIAPRLQAGILWGILQPHAAAAGIDQPAFHARLSPTAMRDALPVLVAACADFFQSSPTSLSRLLRAQEQSAIETLAASDAILSGGSATISTASPPAPDSTGEPPESPSAN